jgi:putative phosphoesterase
VIVGLLSDTHGQVAAAAAGVRLLLAHGAEHLVHCGDVGDGADGRAVLDAMAGTPAVFVYGNNDFDEDDLARHADHLGIVCGGHRAELTLAGRRAVVTHGDDVKVVRKARADAGVDYVFVGHTHVQVDRRDGRVRTINPGALYRASVKSVAVLDTETDELRFLPVSI